MFGLIVIHLKIKEINEKISSYENRLKLYKHLGKKILVERDEIELQSIQKKLDELILMKEKINYLKLFFGRKL